MGSMARLSPPPSRFGVAAPEWQPRSTAPVAVAAVALVLVAGLATAWWFSHEVPGGSDEVPLLVADGVRDDFVRRADPSPLGDARTGQAWEAVSGRWEVHDGAAQVTEPNDLGVRTAAVVDLASSDGAVAVTAASMVRGFGLVWRFEDAFNYWFITAAPEFGSWRLQRLDDGTAVDLGGIGLAPAEDGTTVEVRFEGRTTTIFVDGEPRREVVDDALVEATGVGLLVEGDDAVQAAWDDFVAVPSTPATSANVDPS